MREASFACRLRSLAAPFPFFLSYNLNSPLKSEDDKRLEHWPDWIKTIFDEMDAIEQRFPSTLLNGTLRSKGTRRVFHDNSQ